MRLCEKYGRKDVPSIAAEMEGKTAAEVKQYAQAFWENYMSLNGEEWGGGRGPPIGGGEHERGRGEENQVGKRSKHKWVGWFKWNEMKQNRMQQ